MPLILSLSNLSCISFNIVYIGVTSCIFDFAAFIGIIKGWSRDFAEYDDDDDKVEEKIEKFRMVINYKLLNDNTYDDAYKISNKYSLINSIQWCKYFF